MVADADAFSRPRLLQTAPAAVVDYVAQALRGAPVREWPAANGFTQSIASIVESEGGPRLFVKAAPATDPAGEAVRIGAELAEVIGDLGPALISWAERDGWFVAIYERLAGDAVSTWTAEDIDQLAELSATMRERLNLSELSNSEPYADAFAPLLGTWSALADPAHAQARSVHHVRHRELSYGLRVETLAELEAEWFDAVRPGTVLQYGDIRRDNVMREPSGRLRLVDWTHRWLGPGWADWVRLVPDIAADGLDPEDVFQKLGWAGSQDHEVNVMLAGLAGRCWRDGYLSDIPGLPQLRPMQRLQGDMTLRWLAQRVVR